MKEVFFLDLEVCTYMGENVLSVKEALSVSQFSSCTEVKMSHRRAKEKVHKGE